MLDSAIQTQTAQTQPSYYEKASQFAWALAKVQVDLGWACVTSSPVKAVAISVASLKASLAVVMIPTNTPTIEICGKQIVMDFSIDRYVPYAVAQICNKLFFHPVDKFANFCESCFSYKSGNISVTNTIYRAVGEEILFREIIQNQILPRFLRILPERIGNVLVHPITRVGITSILFAIAHTHRWESKSGVIPQLIGGLVYGTVREISGGMSLPIYVHAIDNLVLKLILE